MEGSWLVVVYKVNDKWLRKEGGNMYYVVLLCNCVFLSCNIYVSVVDICEVFFIKFDWSFCNDVMGKRESVFVFICG